MSVEHNTLSIKARVYNFIRKELYKKHLEENYSTKYKKEEILTDQEKIDLFNQIFKLNFAAHSELNNYKVKRKYKNRIKQLREKRNEKV